MIRLRQIKINVNDYNKDLLLEKCAKKLRIKKDNIINFNIYKKSIDARDKNNILFSFIVDLKLKDESRIKINNDILLIDEDSLKYHFECTGTKKLNNKIVVVGAGPCGLITSYMLTQNGYKVLLIERGSDVDKRDEEVENFWKNNILNENSNVQFGEGGAGTFSDGKLNTLIKDKNNYQRKVFEIFVKCGAPEEIIYENKPHIGTDKLKNMVKNIRNEIIKNGGEVRFNTTLTDINIKDNKIESIILNDNEKIDCDVLVLAIGHSARDTFKLLNKKGLNITNKPFAVGVRIMHNQEDINLSQYGIKNHKILGNASYKLTYTTKSGRGVYTFCMCPGGFVVNSSSSKGLLCINGMSNYKRNEKIANSAVIVTVDSKAFGTDVFDGMYFQEKLESIAYNTCNGLIPITLFKDYMNNTISTKFSNVYPVIKGKFEFVNLNKIFPDYINEALKEGINYFGTKIKCFNEDDAILAGVETRTSSPIRILRNEFFESNIEGIYPAGEGSGYAGGITTSAIDGIKVFESIASKYKK